MPFANFSISYPNAPNMLHIIGQSPLMANASNMPHSLTLPPATAQEITCAQAIVGTLIYNARAVDPTLLVPLSSLASQFSTATSTTITAVSHLLEYYSTHPESSIRYFASDMQLKIHSDASYLSEPKAKSRIGGYFYLSNNTNPPKKPLYNGPLFSTQHYSNMWSHLLLRLNLVHFLSMQKKALSRAYHWLKWVTTRMPQNSKLKTPQQMVLSMIQSSKNSQK
jgi:hypothetical protein